MIFVTEDGKNQVEDLISELHKEINNNNILKKEAMEDAPGDGWHDNFAAEDAARQEVILLEKLHNLIISKSKLEIVSNIVKKDKINIGDIVKIKFIYEDDFDEEIVKLTGLFKPNNENEITLNSPVGKAIYHQKYNKIIKYLINEKEYILEVYKI